jgi:DNA mismatch repair protein MutS2
MGNFKTNDKVMVQNLKREGVILEALKDGSYRVGVGTLTIVCAEKNLKELSPDQWKKYSKLSGPKYSGPKVEAPAGDFTSVDLHGLRLDDALRLVEQKLNEALLADVGRFRILHGVGMGILMTNVHKYLKTLPVVKRFHMDENNPGVTWVYF